METSTLTAQNLKKKKTRNRDGSTPEPEPAIGSCDTGQQIPRYDSCQLIITWTCNIRLQAHILASKCDISHWLPCGVNGRADVRSRDFHNFSDGEITTFSYLWGSVRTPRVCVEHNHRDHSYGWTTRGVIRLQNAETCNETCSKPRLNREIIFVHTQWKTRVRLGRTISYKSLRWYCLCLQGCVNSLLPPKAWRLLGFWLIAFVAWPWPVVGGGWTKQSSERQLNG